MIATPAFPPKRQPSWQRHLLPALLRIFRMMTPSQRLPFPAQRVGIARLLERMPQPKDLRFEPVEAVGQPAGWFRLPGQSHSRVALYLHGGAYVIGTMHMTRPFLAEFCKAAQAHIFAIDYRLAPEYPFPAGLEDAQRAYLFLLEQGIRPAEIALMGESAGGGLVVSLLLQLKAAGLPQPACAVLFSPWLDLALRGDSFFSQRSKERVLTTQFLERAAQAYLAGQDPQHPIASPLFGDLAGLPPLQVQVGTHEILLDDSIRFCARARAAGVSVNEMIWPAMPHSWQIYGDWLPEAHLALAAAAAFLQSNCPQAGL